MDIKEQLAINHQEILDLKDEVRNVMRSPRPKPPDKNKETQSPRPTSEQAVELSTNGAAPVEIAMQNPHDANRNAHRAEGKGG